MSCRAQTVRSFVQRRPIGKIPKEFPKAQFGSRETNPITSPAVLVTQEMIDEWQVNQSDFTIPQTPKGTILTSAFSFTTNNVPPSSDTFDPISTIPVKWNGVTRILITPTMATLPTGGITNQPVNGFKATMSALTLFGTTKIATFTNTGNTYEYNNLVEYQGVSYTISVLTGKDLLKELETTYNPNTDNDTTKIVADALVTKNGMTLTYGTGSSLILEQSMNDINTQYEGTYAVQDIGSKTEPIWESCIIGGTIEKYVKASITNAGETSAKVDFSTSTDTIINVSTSPATTGSIEIPILAMIRVDFPEDLIQELYTDQVSETDKIKLSMMNVAGQLAVEIGYGPTA